MGTPDPNAAFFPSLTPPATTTSTPSTEPTSEPTVVETVVEKTALEIAQENVVERQRILTEANEKAVACHADLIEAQREVERLKAS